MLVGICMRRYRTDDAFNYPSTTDIENAYVDGFSLTHGDAGARSHLFSWGIGRYQMESLYSCPDAGGSSPPPFAGSAWACQSGNDTTSYDSIWYPPRLFEDAFQHLTLGEATTDDLEGRIMFDQPTSDEDIGVCGPGSPCADLADLSPLKIATMIDQKLSGERRAPGSTVASSWKVRTARRPGRAVRAAGERWGEAAGAPPGSRRDGPRSSFTPTIVDRTAVSSPGSSPAPTILARTAVSSPGSSPTPTILARTAVSSPGSSPARPRHPARA